MPCVNKTWQCHFFQVGCPRAVCFHWASFQSLSTTPHARQAGVTNALLPGVPAFWLFPWNFCSVQTIRIGFYFTISFPAEPLPKDGRQFCVPFAATGSSERLEGQPQGEQRCFPPVSQALLMSRRVFTGRGCQTPCSLLNQSKPWQRLLFHPMNCGLRRSPSFHFPNSLLAARSTQTDIILH